MDRQGGFSVVNGRTIYDGADAKLWRCPRCVWWIRWEVAHCVICGLDRDGAAPPHEEPPQRPQAAAARGAAEMVPEVGVEPTCPVKGAGF